MKLKTIVISGANDYTPTVLQGYVGGISMENVLNELDKINQVVPEDREIFIDAEGKLKGEDGHLSFGLAGEYLRRASCWDKEHNG